MKRSINVIQTWDFTLPLDISVCIYGNAKRALVKSLSTSEDFQKISNWIMSPNSGTHVEFNSFRSINAENTPSMLPLKCILIDVSWMSGVMNDFLRTSYTRGDLPEKAYYCWNPGDLKKLSEKMKISASDLEWLKQYGDEYLIIFYTGWRSYFSPGNGDLSDIDWIPWHPYFIHPYIDESAIKFLFSDTNGLRISGLGVDIFSIDSPLGMLNSELYTKISNDIRNNLHEILPLKDGEADFGGYRHLDEKARLHNKIMLAQLTIPPEVFLYSESVGKTRYKRGTLLLLPYKYSRSDGVALLSVFFKEGWDD